MNLHATFSLAFLLLITSLNAQDYEWATLIDNVTANEVAGLDIDSDGNVALCGIRGADQSLPYNGEAYVTKTDSDGNTIWSHTLGSELHIGDLVCAGDRVVIVAQSTATIELDGVTIAEAAGEAFMALIILDADGGVVSANGYSEYHGQFADLDYDDGSIALHCRGASNIGENVLFFSSDGTQTSAHAIESEATFNSLAYFNGWTYMTGATSAGEGLNIDLVDLPPGDQDGLAVLVAFDQSFTATWGHAKDAINPNDSRVVAGNTGIYSYQSVLQADLEFSNEIWKFDAAGVIIDSIQPPTFSSSVSLYPDLALSDCHLVLFTANSSDFNAHEVTLYDENLNLVEEKEIVGNSNLYSGQVATHADQIYVAHVHTDELDFNGETMIFDELDDAFQYPYLAKIAVADNCGPVAQGDCSIGEIDFTLQPCFYGQFFVTIEFEYEGTSDEFFVFNNGEQIGTNPYGEAPYLLGPFSGDGNTVYNIEVVDAVNQECANSFSFVALDCGVGECVIENFDMGDVFCDTDSTYSMTFTADFINPTADTFEVWVNTDSVGVFAITDVPLTLGGLSPSGGEFDFITVCVSDNSFCCMVVDYDSPDCTPDALMEFDDQMALFPNPTNGRLELQLPANMEVVSLELMDALGRPVLTMENDLRAASGVHLMDLSDLSQGSYLLRLVTDKGVYGSWVVRQ